MEGFGFLEIRVIHCDERSRSKPLQRHMNEQPEIAKERSPFKEPKFRVFMQGSGHNEQIHVRIVTTKYEETHRNEKIL